MLTTVNNSGYINGAVAQGPVGSKAAVQSKPQGFISWVVKSVIGDQDLGPGGNIQLRHGFESLRDSNALRSLHQAA